MDEIIAKIAEAAWQDEHPPEPPYNVHLREVLEAVANDIIEACAKEVESKFLEPLNKYVCYADDVASHIRYLKTPVADK